jgi:biotin carboxyl carrier protein
MVESGVVSSGSVVSTGTSVAVRGAADVAGFDVEIGIQPAGARRMHTTAVPVIHRHRPWFARISIRAYGSSSTPRPQSSDRNAPMATAINIPQLGMSMERGTLVEWFVADGDTCNEGQVIYLLETDKVENDIESPVSGVIHLSGVEGEDTTSARRSQRSISATAPPGQ